MLKYLFILKVFCLIVLTASAQNRDLSLQTAHKGNIWNLAFSNDNRYVASNSIDNMVKVWDVYTGYLLKTYADNLNPYTTLWFSPKDGYLCGRDFFGVYTLFPFRRNDGQFAQGGVLEGVKAIYFNADETKVLYGDYYGKLTLRDLTTATEISAQLDASPILGTCLDEKTGDVWAVCESKKLYHLNSKLVVLRQLSINTTDIKHCAFSTSCNYMVLSSQTAKISVYTLPALTLVGSQQPDVSGLTSFEFFNADKNLLVKCGTNSYLLFNLPALTPFFSSKYLMAACVSKLSNLMAYHKPDGNIDLLDVNNQKVLSTYINPEGKYITALSPNGKYMASSTYDGRIKLFDTGRQTEIKELKGISHYYSYIMFHPDGEHFIAVTSDGQLNMWNLNTGHLDLFAILPDTAFTDLVLSTDGKSICMASKTGVGCAALDNLNVFSQQIVEKQKVTAFAFSNNGNFFVYAGGDNMVYILKTSNLSKINSIKSLVTVESVAVSDDGKTVYMASKNTLKVFNVKDGKNLKTLRVNEGKICEMSTIPLKDALAFSATDKKLYLLTDKFEKKEFDDPRGFYITSSKDAEMNFPLAISPDNSLVASVGEGWSIIVRETSGYTQKAILSGHGHYVVKLCFSPDNKKIVSTSTDGSIKIWDIASQKEILTLIFDKNNYVAYTPDGYYKKSRLSANLVCFRDNLNVYSFEQFDLLYNRPDIVMARLGYTPDDMINVYHTAYLKRLEKMGISESDLHFSGDLPSMLIVNLDSIKLKTSDNLVTLKLKAEDKLSGIDRITIWVNGVPVTGSAGIRPPKKQQIVFDLTYKVTLASGTNKIEVSCLNIKGLESLRQTLVIQNEHAQALKPSLYLAVISVSEYKDNSMNLRYAVKDGRDMVNFFKQNTTQYFAQIYADTLFNTEAVKANLPRLKNHLAKAGVNDYVVLYVSGHGLLDDKLDFYFATHDMDFAKPALKGISYDALEELLDSISPRKKLFLMDACHSGELDKSSVMAQTNSKVEDADGKRSGVTTYTFRGASLVESDVYNKLGLQNSFEMMQEMFANLNRGSGTVVISAAAGQGFALEGERWNNGVFTYCIMNGLNTLSNSGKPVTVTQLKDFVCTEVEKLTKGAQKPTSRRESLEFDWRIW